MKMQGTVEAVVRIEREVIADDLASAKLLLENEVYGTLHGVAGVKGIAIQLVHVETVQHNSGQAREHGEDLQAQRERSEERQFLPSTPREVMASRPPLWELAEQNMPGLEIVSWRAKEIDGIWILDHLVLRQRHVDGTEQAHRIFRVTDGVAYELWNLLKDSPEPERIWPKP